MRLERMAGCGMPAACKVTSCTKMPDTSPQNTGTLTLQVLYDTMSTSSVSEVSDIYLAKQPSWI